jgi:hypothetical protein
VDSRRNAYDLWLARDLGSSWRVQLGQIRVAMASEYSTREENFPLIGQSFTSYLTGRYDLGIRGEAGFLQDAIGFEAVAAAGAGSGLEGEGKDDPFFLARGTWQPLRNLDLGPLRGAFVGLAAAYQPEFRDEVVVATPLESVIFTTPDLDADRAQWFALETGWYHGPFRFGFEQVRGILDNVAVPGGGTKDMDELWGWTAYASVFLWGGRPAWTRGAWRKPYREPGSQPVELGVRYSNGDIDRDFFDFGVTTYDPSSQENRTFSVNLAWYPIAGMRAAAGWVQTIADDPVSTFGGTNRDSTVLLRFEVDF